MASPFSQTETPDPSEVSTQAASPAESEDLSPRDNASEDLDDAIADNDTVIDTWTSERASFYRDDLELSDEELKRLETISQDFHKQMPAGMVVSTPEGEDPAYAKLHENYEQKVLQFLGDKRFERAAEFRRNFNDNIGARFGSRTNVASFDFF